MLVVLTPQTWMLDVPGVIAPEEADTVALPGATPDTRPPVLTVTIPVGVDVQVAVTGPVLPSLKVPVAVNWTVHGRPGTGAEHGEIEAIAGVTLIWFTVGFVKNPLQPAISRNTTVAKANHTRPARP